MIKYLVHISLVLGLVSCATSKRVTKKVPIENDDEEYGFGTEEDYNSVFYQIGVEQRLSQSAYSNTSDSTASDDDDSSSEEESESSSESASDSSEEEEPADAE